MYVHTTACIVHHIEPSTPPGRAGVEVLVAGQMTSEVEVIHWKYGMCDSFLREDDE